MSTSHGRRGFATDNVRIFAAWEPQQAQKIGLCHTSLQPPPKRGSQIKNLGFPPRPSSLTSFGCDQFVLEFFTSSFSASC